jgi:hypothetical protein
MDRSAFKPGARYRPLKNFAGGGPQQSQFVTQEKLTFVHAAYSKSDASFEFVFRNKAGEKKSWWVHKDASANLLKTYFKRVWLFG